MVSFHVIDDSCSSPTEDLDVIFEIRAVKNCNGLDSKKYVQSDSIVDKTWPNEVLGYYIWTEDKTVFVLSTVNQKY